MIYIIYTFYWYNGDINNVKHATKPINHHEKSYVMLLRCRCGIQLFYALRFHYYYIGCNHRFWNAKHGRSSTPLKVQTCLRFESVRWHNLSNLGEQMHWNVVPGGDETRLFCPRKLSMRFLNVTYAATTCSWHRSQKVKDSVQVSFTLPFSHVTRMQRARSRQTRQQDSLRCKCLGT